MINVAIFVSGNGTNCENLINHFAASQTVRVALVLSNKPEAYALVRAERHGVPTATITKQQFADSTYLLSLLQQYHIHFIVLAGFLLMIPDYLIHAFHRRMVNLHPALLPKYGGKGMYGHHVHEAVKAAGDHETGLTVHWVSSVCDGGEIISQYKTPLLPTDTAETIAQKEQALEQAHFPQIIEKVLQQTFPSEYNPHSLR